MQFGEWLRSRQARSLVLLIDNYDAPLATVHGDEALFKAVWSRQEAFFLRTKSCAEVFRFFFMTGEAKFTWAGPFGGFNDVIDVSADPEFAGLVGLTEAELREGCMKIPLGIKAPGFSLRFRSIWASPGDRTWPCFSFRPGSFLSSLGAGGVSSSAVRIRRRPQSWALSRAVDPDGPRGLRNVGGSLKSLPDCFLYALYQEERRKWRAVDALQ